MHAWAFFEVWSYSKPICRFNNKGKLSNNPLAQKNTLLEIYYKIKSTF